MPRSDPFQTADAQARILARDLIDTATFAALAVLRPDYPAPSVTRVACATDAAGAPITLISQLSTHTAALAVNPACALLLGEPEGKGDPLTHPRLTRSLWTVTAPNMRICAPAICTCAQRPSFMSTLQTFGLSGFR